jgi:hypothetical protein
MEILPLQRVPRYLMDLAQLALELTLRMNGWISVPLKIAASY